MFRWAVIVFPVVSAVWIQLGSTGTLHFTLADALLLFAVLGALVASSSVPRLAVRIFMPVLVLEALAIATTTFHFGLDLGLFDGMIQAKRFVEYSAIIIPASRLKTTDRRRTVLLLMVLSVVLTAVAVTEVGSGRPRATSLLFYENNFGLYCTILFGVSISFLLFEQTLSRFKRSFAAVAVCASVTGLVLSGSRAASVGFVAATVVVIALLPKGRRSVSVLLVGVTTTVVVGAFAVGQTEIPQYSLLTRWQEAADLGGKTVQLESRMEASQLAWAALRDNGVLFGLGVSGLPFYTAKYIEDPFDWRIGADVRNTGNQLMQVFAELGLVGLFPLFLLIYRLSRLCWTRPTGPRPPTAVSSSLLVSLTVLVFAGGGMHTLYVPQVMGLVWTIVGFRIGEISCYYDKSRFIRCFYERGRRASRSWQASAGPVCRGY